LEDVEDRLGDFIKFNTNYSGRTCVTVIGIWLLAGIVLLMYSSDSKGRLINVVLFHFLAPAYVLTHFGVPLLTDSVYDKIYYYTLLYAGVPLLLVFHVVFVLSLVAYWNAIMTDPGMVPPNWGFYMGDETKRRRYCKMCNVWKPDRTHHCSICNRCILNMDHHCPWINNCVGFYNRKFFMLFVVYTWMCLVCIAVSSYYNVFASVKYLFTITTLRH